jgi:hypothetical protein
MLELKVAQLQDEPEPRRSKKLGPLVAEAVAAHSEFLKRFNKDGKPPARVDEESEQAYVTSRLSLARAYSKLVTSASLGEALEQYKTISAFLKANQVKGLEGEAKVTDEMCELLPIRIHHLKKQEAMQG